MSVPAVTGRAKDLSEATRLQLLSELGHFLLSVIPPLLQPIVVAALVVTHALLL